jgi:hypothetical protein
VLGVGLEHGFVLSERGIGVAFQIVDLAQGHVRLGQERRQLEGLREHLLGLGEVLLRGVALAEERIGLRARGGEPLRLFRGPHRLPPLSERGVGPASLQVIGRHLGQRLRHPGQLIQGLLRTPRLHIGGGQAQARPRVVGHPLGYLGELGDRQTGATGPQRHLPEKVASQDEVRESLGEAGEKADGLIVPTGA